MGAYVAGILLSLISAPLLVRHLGVVEFGRYVLVTAVLGVAGGILDAGLLGIAQREYVARTGEDRDRTMANLLGLRLTLVASAVALAVAFSAVANYGGAVTAGMLLAGCAALLAATGHVWVTPIVAELRYGVLTVMELAGQVITVVLMVVLIVAGASFVPFLAIGVPISAVM